MSARMMQRALREAGVASMSPVAPVPEEEVEEEEEEDVTQVVRNPFDLLGLQDGDDVEEVELHEDTSASAGLAYDRFPVASPAKSKKKKKGGKKKGKASARDKEHVAGTSEQVTQSEGGVAVAEGDAGSRDVETPLPQSSGRGSVQLLAVDPKFLRADNELRRIFGSKVINAVERKGDSGGYWQRRHGMRRGSRALKKTILTSPADNWPRRESDLSMECTRAKEGLQFFRYVYSAGYLQTQKAYEECVKTHDPNSIALLLAQHPYHVESLFAMAELHRQMGQYQQAAQYLERCLFAMESAWHPLFDPTLGTCRLDFSHEPNRPFFLALFRHMQHLGRRGCHRTALEVCKLLLSLDSDDPLGALFCIDYFALRAEQYEWLEKFVEEYGTDKPLSLFPNFALSLAIARFRIEEKEKSPHASARRAVASVIENAGKASSISLLKQALMLHPTMLPKIVEKAPIKEDAVWLKITQHPFFSRATVGSPTLEHLISIYLERNGLLWRASEVQGWLKEAATAIVQVVDNKDDGEAATWGCVRDEAFQNLENEYGNLLVSDFSDTAASLPPEELQQMGFHDVHEVPDIDELNAINAINAAWLEEDDSDYENDAPEARLELVLRMFGNFMIRRGLHG